MQAGNTYKRTAAFSLLLVGPPKSGKTTLTTAFPDPYFLDADRNLAGALRRYEPPKFWFDTPQETYPKIEDEHKLWEYSVRCLQEAIASPDVKTIIVDGISNLSIWLQTAILYGARSTQKLRVAGEAVMEQAYWGPFRNKMVQLILALKASGKFLIVTCHEDTLTSETGAVIGYRPMIPGQLKHNLAGLFSDCWRCETSDSAKGAAYKVRFQPRNLMQIGNSLNIQIPSLDLTNRSPVDIWKDINSFIEAKPVDCPELSPNK